jgi:predicted membrane chloride channel (bestrophin family)
MNKQRPKEEIGKGLNEDHYEKVKAARKKSKRVTFLLTDKEQTDLQDKALKEGYINISDYIRLKLKL